MSAPVLTLDGDRLMCDGVELGVVTGPLGGWGKWLDTPFAVRCWHDIAAFEADMMAHPDVAFRHAEAAIADAHGASNEAVSAARCGDKDAVVAALARCDAHIARANAWRRLAGDEVTP